MEFKYKAKKSLDETVEGSIYAASLEEALQRLEEQGIVPVHIQAKEEPAAKAFKKSARIFSAGWGLKKIALFTQKLYNLTKSNVELLTALILLEQDSKDHFEKQLLGDIIRNVKDGLPLSECLGRHPECFSSMYVDLIRAGEGSGQLKASLAQLVAYLKRLEGLKLRIQQALAYPIFMVFVGGLTIFVMLSFIFPRLAGMFDDFQAALPLPTQILLSISGFFQSYWLFIGLALGGLSLVFKHFYSRKKGLFSFLHYRLPMIGKIVYKQSAANFSNSLSVLLKSGVSLLTALGIAAPIIGNPKYISQLKEAAEAIKSGASFSQALERFKIFPDFFVQMIKVGEAGGRLDSVLADIAASYEEEIESDLKIISSLIEPVIILLLGIVIGGMVTAMLLPIFSINALVGE